MKYFVQLLIAATLCMSLQAQANYIFNRDILDFQCGTSEGTIIKFKKLEKYCPDTGHKCNPVVEMTPRSSITYNDRGFPSYITFFDAPNGPQNRYRKSAAGSLYFGIWAVDARGTANSSLEIFMDLKTCKVSDASKNVSLVKPITCQLTLPEKARRYHYSFSYNLPSGGWASYSAQYSDSPCIQFR